MIHSFFFILNIKLLYIKSNIKVIKYKSDCAFQIRFVLAKYIVFSTSRIYAILYT